MEVKNAIFKEIEMKNGKKLRTNNIVNLKPYGRIMVNQIILKNGKIIVELKKDNKIITHDYEYIEKNVEIIFNESYEMKITLGDWSDDGHGEYKSYGIISNYKVEELRKAYKDSCKLTGITFNHNEDYTGLLKGEYGHWRQLFTEYESSSISSKAFKILEEFKLIEKSDWIDEYYEEGDNIMIDTDYVPKLIMDFIALSMPDDFTYVFANIGLEKAKPINGWWNRELNVQFGYGLFD